MPDSPGGPTDNPLLRGLFGVFQNGASQHLDTATIWSDLRTAAGSWQFQAQGAAQPYDPAAVEAAGREILSAQGVNAATVSTFRGIAGAWLGAKGRLAELDTNQQISSGEIFQPPWAITSSSAVDSRFRIRTQWQFESAAGATMSVWKTDELTAPLTTPGDALSQASLAPSTQSAPTVALAAEPPVLAGFEIEQI